MNPEQIIYLVDDEEAVRDALSFMFTSHGLSVKTYENGAVFLDHLFSKNAQTKLPQLRGCIVLDVRMEPLSGLQVHDELVARGVTLPVIFLTGHGDIPMAVDALKKGAFDFIEKPFSDVGLIDRIQTALKIEAINHTQLNQRERDQARWNALTKREQEVLERVAAGKLNKIIADELCVSLRTIEVHRARALAKLGVRSSAQVATLLSGLQSDDNKSV